MRHIVFAIYGNLIDRTTKILKYFEWRSLWDLYADLFVVGLLALWKKSYDRCVTFLESVHKTGYTFQKLKTMIENHTFVLILLFQGTTSVLGMLWLSVNVYQAGATGQ